MALEDVYRFLERYPQTRTIIVNGGDPLMMPPQYYWDLIAHLDARGLETTISLTTNLWAFYKKPQMWEELFRHPRVGVATSFQYGNARLKGNLTPFTEEEFWAISDLMLERVGYRPTFIAVITPENEDTVIQTVELAKRMGVVCKVNYAVGSGTPIEFKGIRIGNRDRHYLLADIYERYLEIYRAGLADWEHNTQQMLAVMKSYHTICPLNRDCDVGIRSLQPSGRYYSCGAFGDDDEYRIDFEQEMQGAFFRPLQNPELLSLKSSCFSCPMFEICNGCKKTIHEMKRGKMVERHCRKMKTLAPEILEISGLAGVVSPTPYVQEYPE